MRRIGRLPLPVNITLLILVSVLGSLLLACAPQPPQPTSFSVGILNLSPITEDIYKGFKAEMETLGYNEGQRIEYIYSGPVGHDQEALSAAAKALVDSNVDLIFSITTPASDHAKEATQGTDIPVIFYGIRDPRASGYVEDLQRPGGNMTGITIGIEGTPTEGRRLEWLKQIAPQVQHIFLPYNPNDALSVQSMETVKNAAAELGVEVTLQQTTSQEESLAAIEAIPDDVDAIFPISGLADPVFAVVYPQVAEIALEQKLPLSIPVRLAASDGVLMSFGPEYEAIGRQAAGMADQILQGAKPADLPVEIPQFFLMVNLATARAIGVEVPNEIIQQADFVIR